MPDQPTWIERVPRILATLDAAGVPAFLDRPAIEALFGLRRRQSIELMRRLGGYKVGKTFLVDRAALVRFLQDPRRRSAHEIEAGRFQRVLDVLGNARQELHQRRIPIPSLPPAPDLSLAGLPDGVQLDAGKLTVTFHTGVELLQKLFALSQALSNDYEAFESSLNLPQGGQDT